MPKGEAHNGEKKKKITHTEINNNKMFGPRGSRM